MHAFHEGIDYRRGGAMRGPGAVACEPDWEFFLPDDDESLPEPGDFWFEPDDEE